MNYFVAPPKALRTCKVSGRITGYKSTRARASFVFGSSDQTTMGAAAMAAAAVGASGQAMATASNSTDLEEEADFVEFSVDGKQVRGWLWRSPFQEGDVVDIAAERSADGYAAFGIHRPIDGLVAVYPHCVRGRMRHVRIAVKWWLLMATMSVLIICGMDMAHGGIESVYRAVDEGVIGWLAFGAFSFFGAMIFSLSRRWLPFTQVAENVFRTLGWSNPSMIDLKKRTKAQRRPDDPVELGIFYFRY